MMNWILLGDPSMTVMAKTPGELQLLGLDSSVYTGVHTFTWTVWDPQSYELIDNATVTLYKSNDCYVVDTTNQWGDVTFEADLSTSGQVYVTATKADFVADEQSMTVAACPVAKTGDVNMNGTITSSDIQYLVNYVFHSGPAPLPCAAAGDVNRSATVTSGDITYLVAYVFQGGPAPLDVCPLIEQGTWSCP